MRQVGKLVIAQIKSLERQSGQIGSIQTSKEILAQVQHGELSAGRESAALEMRQRIFAEQERVENAVRGQRGQLGQRVSPQIEIGERSQRPQRRDGHVNEGILVQLEQSQTLEAAKRGG